jgi:hypothetical protein
MLEIRAPVASIVVVIVAGGSVVTLAPVVVVGDPVVFRVLTPAFALPVLVPDVVVLEFVPVIGLVAAVESVVVVSGVVVGTGGGVTTGFAGGLVGGLVVGLVVGSVVGFGIGSVVESFFVVSCFVVSVAGIGVGVGGFVGVCAMITAGRTARPATPRKLSLIGSPSVKQCVRFPKKRVASGGPRRTKTACFGAQKKAGKSPPVSGFPLNATAPS